MKLLANELLVGPHRAEDLDEFNTILFKYNAWIKDEMRQGKTKLIFVSEEYIEDLREDLLKCELVRFVEDHHACPIIT